jgi:hypothetical protein
VNSGFLDTNRIFAHDAAKYPFTFQNLHSEDLKTWVAQGFEIGAHTVNHMDMGQYTGAG